MKVLDLQTKEQLQKLFFSKLTKTGVKRAIRRYDTRYNMLRNTLVNSLIVIKDKMYWTNALVMLEFTLEQDLVEFASFDMWTLEDKPLEISMLDVIFRQIDLMSKVSEELSFDEAIKVTGPIKRKESVRILRNKIGNFTFLDVPRTLEQINELLKKKYQIEEILVEDIDINKSAAFIPILKEARILTVQESLYQYRT